jgi:hypothetical protein
VTSFFGCFLPQKVYFVYPIIDSFVSTECASPFQLAGAVLEAEERGATTNGSSPKTDELIAGLSSATKDPAVTAWLPPHIVQMIASLVELRAANWGQQQQQQQQQQVPAEYSNQHQQQYNIPQEVRCRGCSL